MTPATWRAVLRNIQALEERDASIRHRQSQRALLQAEVELLEEVREQVEELRTRRRLHDTHVVEEQTKIDGFAEANAELIGEVVAEATAREHELRIHAGYEQFFTAIKLYRDGLPSGLLADLSETTKDLYNSFNPHDHANDILADLTLPQRGGKRIMVSFAGTPAQRHDALAVLSEGHLRCLGLAILLAKNIKLNLPLLVFDDAVNAIDHDHREGIRDTLFGDARLREKQMVITCHGNEFINQVQQRLGQGASALYILKHHDGDHQPRVFGGTDRNYLRRAIERLENNDERQALASSRQALENLTAKTWKSLTNRHADLGQLNLLLRGPTGEPELRNLVDGLSKAVAAGIEQARLNGQTWAQRQEALTELLQLPWRYLNKGTHDGDGEDFEIAIVRRMVNSLGKLSASFPE
ncbi:ATP-binding protein [Xanthomonas euvesicatoria]|uniref:ATP-binding protein n=1 Tax=Xanthomonas euvesicatoria TaxID=456327 RepID=UPI001C44DBB9|nr:ATP-binding protein [Xanthomonas euvesicatoria]MBV6829948.1 ATP-binding protein [Xanthomonas campestris pv. viegasii]